MRILLGDDHPLLLYGIRALLGQQHDVVGIACNGRELVETAFRLSPDLVILDISMPQLNGIEAARQISARLPAKIIFLSMHTDPVYLKNALDAGARGYVLKTGAAEELLEALQAVAEGDYYFSPGFGPDVLENLWLVSGKRARGKALLTARQRQIVQLIADGRASKEIAHLLRISLRTVEFHRAQAIERLGSHSTAQLVRIAMERKLIAGSEVHDLHSRYGPLYQ